MKLLCFVVFLFLLKLGYDLDFLTEFFNLSQQIDEFLILPEKYSFFASNLIRAITWSSLVSWLCFGVMYYDSVRPGIEPKPLSPMTMMEKAKRMPPRRSSLNFFLALCLGPMVTAAFFL